MFAKRRRILLYHPRGAGKVTRAMLHLRDTHPRSKVIEQTLAYFRANQHRMHYTARRENNLPIGSGVVESCMGSLAATYKMDVDVIAQVIPLHGKP